MSVEVTPEQVRKGLAQARDAAPKYLPAEAQPFITPVLDGLDKRADAVAKVGTAAALQGLAYFAVINPFADDPKSPQGYAAGRAAIQSAGDRLQDDRDAEIAAMNELRELVLDVGRDAIKVVLPLLVASLL